VIPYHTTLNPYQTDLHDTEAAWEVERNAQRRTPLMYLGWCMWTLSRGRRAAYSHPPTEEWSPHVDLNRMRDALNSIPDPAYIFMVRIRLLPDTN
jgi:hypothetical protein